MKRALFFVTAFLVAFGLFTGTKAEKAYSETPVLPVEDNVEAYLDKIVQVPSADDSRWEQIPKEEMATQMQFLVDQQNSNYDRIRSWRGSYYQIRNSSINVGDFDLGKSSPPVKIVYEDLFTFACDLAKDKSFIRLDRLYEQYYDKDGNKVDRSNKVQVNSDVCAILTKDQYVYYDFGVDQIRGELEGVMPGRIGKICLLRLSEKKREVSWAGTLFDPRQFFIWDISETAPKRWHNIETAYIPWLRGERDEALRQRALDRLTVQRGEFDGVIWYRVVYSADDGTIAEESVFNSESNFNMVLSRQCSNGVAFTTVAAKYRALDDIFIPDQCVFISRRGGFARYFKYIESVLNEKIPSDQFALEALGLDPDVVVLDEAKEVSYKYVNGKLKPIAEFGASESYVENKSFWSSPARIVAFVVGLTLIAFGVVRRFRKRRAQS